MNSSVLAAVRGLRFRYPDGSQALDGVDFELREGETVALLGPNGSGKTTFLHLLVGLLTGEGDISICGQNSAEDPAFVRRRIGLLFQDSNDQLFMPTVAADVAFGPRHAGVSEAEIGGRVEAALEAVGLGGVEERAPHHLSAGQKRLAALAGLLSMEPKILLLDEPATFLDPPARTRLIEVLSELPQAKIVVTHDVGLASVLAQRAVFFRQGRVVDEGPVPEVAARQSWQ